MNALAGRLVQDRRFHLLGLLVVAGLVFAFGRAIASGSAPAPAESTTPVVLSGSYGCIVQVTRYGGLPGDPQPPQEYRETSQTISIHGTGLSSATPMIGVGPGFGGVPRTGRPSPGGLGVVDLDLGSGVGTSFNGGTLDDCARLAEAIQAAVRGEGCETSQVRRREPVPFYVLDGGSTAFSFVCESSPAGAVRTIGNLDRAVISRRLASAE
jgi:hypothetical protein